MSPRYRHMWNVHICTFEIEPGYVICTVYELLSRACHCRASITCDMAWVVASTSRTSYDVRSNSSARPLVLVLQRQTDGSASDSDVMGRAPRC